MLNTKDYTFYLFFCLTEKGLKEQGERKMWVIQYFDWHGTMKELEELDKIVEKECEKAEGLKYKGRYGPHNRKYHWAYFYKAESYNHFNAMGQDIPRDYNKMSHILTEIFE